MIYHVLNRGNGRLRLLHKEGDYDACGQDKVSGSVMLRLRGRQAVRDRFLDLGFPR